MPSGPCPRILRENHQFPWNAGFCGLFDGLHPNRRRPPAAARAETLHVAEQIRIWRAFGSHLRYHNINSTHEMAAVRRRAAWKGLAGCCENWDGALPWRASGASRKVADRAAWKGGRWGLTEESLLLGRPGPDGGRTGGGRWRDHSATIPTVGPWEPSLIKRIHNRERLLPTPFARNRYALRTAAVEPFRAPSLARIITVPL